MSPRVLVPLAEGFEEIEAATIIDVLRRAEANVHVASIGPSLVKGSHSLSIMADGSLNDCTNRHFDMIVLPGGMPGSSNLAASQELKAILKQHHSHGRMIGAICAAPAVVLAPLGILGDEKIACFPSYLSHLPEHNRCSEQVCVSKHFITSRGPGTAIMFALEIVTFLAGKTKTDELAKAMIVS